MKIKYDKEFKYLYIYFKQNENEFSYGDSIGNRITVFHGIESGKLTKIIVHLAKF